MSIVNPTQLPAAQPLKKTDIMIIQQEQTCQAPLSYLDIYFAPVASFKNTSIAETTTLINYTVPDVENVLYVINGAGTVISGSGLFNADVTIFFTDTAGNSQVKVFANEDSVIDQISPNPVNIFAKQNTNIGVVLTIVGNPIVDFAISLQPLL